MANFRLVSELVLEPQLEYVRNLPPKAVDSALPGSRAYLFNARHREAELIVKAAKALDELNALRASVGADIAQTWTEDEINAAKYAEAARDE